MTIFMPLLINKVHKSSNFVQSPQIFYKVLQRNVLRFLPTFPPHKHRVPLPSGKNSPELNATHLRDWHNSLCVKSTRKLLYILSLGHSSNWLVYQYKICGRKRNSLQWYSKPIYNLFINKNPLTVIPQCLTASRNIEHLRHVTSGSSCDVLRIAM